MIDIWGEAVRSIEDKVKPAHRDLWLRPIECVAIGEGHIRLRAPNRYHKEWFEDNYLPSILEDLRTRTQCSYTVDFEITELGPTAAALHPAPPSGDVPALASFEPRVTVDMPPPRELDRRYTFERFVVGPTNQFAHAACRARGATAAATAAGPAAPRP